MNPATSQAKLVALAAAEPDAMVRSQLASSCQRWDADDALPILGRLARRDEDRKRPAHPEPDLVGLRAAIAAGPRRGRRAAEHERDAAACRWSRRRSSSGSRGRWSPRAPTATSRRVPACWRPRRARSRRRGSWPEWTRASRAGRLARVPAPLADPLSRLWDAAQPAPGCARSGWRPGWAAPPAIAAAVRPGPRPAGRRTDRAAMIELLGQLGRAEDLPVLLGLLGASRARRSSSPRSPRWGVIAQASVAAPLLERYRSAAPAVRARILGLLCTRPPWADALAGRDRAAADRRQGPDPGSRPARSRSCPTRRCSAGSRRSGEGAARRARPRKSSGSPRSAACCPRATRATPPGASRSSRRTAPSATSSSTRGKRSAPT